MDSKLEHQLQAPKVQKLMNNRSASFTLKNPTFKVLVANDDAMQLCMLKVLFQKCNFEVVTALNGKEALDRVASNLENLDTPFNLIFLDLQMPVMDGYCAIRAIRNKYDTFKRHQALKPKQQSTFIKPFIQPQFFACSALINESVQRKAQEARFCSVVSTPISLNFIKQSIIPTLLGQSPAPRSNSQGSTHQVNTPTDVSAIRNRLQHIVSQERYNQIRITNL